MKTLQNIFLYILLVAMAACSADQDIIETDVNETNPEGQPISFRIGLGALTKVTTDEKFRSQFEEGDEIGVFMVTAGQILKSSGNYADNVKLTYTGGQWIQEGEAAYYPVDGSSLDFYAYYPYAADINPLNFQFEIKENQQNDQAYSKNDLLYAKVENLRNKDVPLLFSHLLSLVQVEIVREGDLVSFDETFTVSFLSQYNSVQVNLANGTAAEQTASSIAIKMNRVEEEGNTKTYTYRALVPAYTIPEEEVIFTFIQTTPGKTMDFKYSVETDTELTPNKVSKWKITLEGDPIPPHYYAVGDLYPHDDTPIGIVFEIWNEGINGKVVSLNEKRDRWGNLPLDESSRIEDIRNEDNGREATYNLIRYYRDSDLFGTQYIVFKWLYEELNNGDINGVWYAPAKKELMSLYAAMSGLTYEDVAAGWSLTGGAMPNAQSDACKAAREEFNAKVKEGAALAGLTGDPLTQGFNLYGRYWTSTEYNEERTWFIWMETGILSSGTESANKKSDDYCRLRGILEF